MLTSLAVTDLRKNGKTMYDMVEIPESSERNMALQYLADQIKVNDDISTKMKALTENIISISKKRKQRREEIIKNQQQL